MILYVDTSSLVKRYVLEAGSDLVNQIISNAEITGMSVIGQVETAAAFSKTIRVGVLKEEKALAAWRLFQVDWREMMQIQVTKTVIVRAHKLAWEYGLHGYDAVHLASAIIWQEVVAQPVTMAVFDKKLWTAVKQIGLTPFPSDLSEFSD